ncbi:MAG: hypothetical protein A4E68_00425 [Syntrophaceae bacterium PtaB.Bin095]|nr:MAG: hypothetical protein A4E68_00425 [Syntrophaceae bacterium PtaB.Bin095]
MIGRFAARIFVTGVAAPVGAPGIVEKLLLMADFQGQPHGTVGEAADGAGNEQLPAGFQDRAADFRVADRPQGEGQQLIGAQGVVGFGQKRALSRSGVTAVRQITCFGIPEEGLNAGLNFIGQILPAPFFLMNAGKKFQGRKPEGLNLNGVALPGGAGREIGIHPGKVRWAEKQARGGIHDDAVGRSRHDGRRHVRQDLTDGSSVAVAFQEMIMAFGRNQVRAGSEKPQGGVRGVAVACIPAANHVGKGPVGLKTGELE